MCNALLRAKYLRSAFVLSPISTCKCFSSYASGGVFKLGWCFLQIRTLTELCLFTEAVKEAVHVTQGTGVCLPNGHYINQDNLQVWTHMHNLSWNMVVCLPPSWREIVVRFIWILVRDRLYDISGYVSFAKVVLELPLHSIANIVMVFVYTCHNLSSYRRITAVNSSYTLCLLCSLWRRSTATSLFWTMLRYFLWRISFLKNIRGHFTSVIPWKYSNLTKISP